MAEQKETAAKVESAATAAEAPKVAGAQTAAAAAPAAEVREDAPADLFVGKANAAASGQAQRIETANRIRAFKAQVDEYNVALAVNKSDIKGAINATCSLSAAIATIANTGGAEQHEMLNYLVDTIATSETGAFTEERPFLYLGSLRKENRERYVGIITCLVTYAGLTDKRAIHNRQSIPYVASAITNARAKKSFIAYFKQ